MIYIIAAIGTDVSGNLSVAEEMIKVAKKAGADAIKFPKNTEFSFENWQKIKKLCDDEKIEFLCAVNRIGAEMLYVHFHVNKFRVDSSEITNHEFLKYLGDLGLPILLSTGMCTLYEISEAVRVIGKNSPLTLLHCVSEYPTPLAKINLKMIPALQMLFEVPVGFSDHTTNVIVPALAVVAGAEVIEKHFALEKSYATGESTTCLRPEELEQMVTNVRTAEVMLGSPIKKITDIERDIRRHLGK